MSTTVELNNWIEQQINSKEENAVMNKQAEVLYKNNNMQMILLKEQNVILEKSEKLRHDQDIAIDESIAQYKKAIRNGDYGEELKNMKFVDEK